MANRKEGADMQEIREQSPDKPIEIKIEQGRGCYKVYANGKFYCACDDLQEADQEIKELRENISCLMA